MSTLIGVTEDKTEVFFASLPHLKEEYFHQLVDGFFREGMVSENESGLVLLKEIPEFFACDKRKSSCQLLDASIFVCAITGCDKTLD